MTADSRRFKVLLSNCCAFHVSHYIFSEPRTAFGLSPERTVALVTINSTSPREALISSANFSQTPFRLLKRLYSARVDRKFLTVSLEPEPRDFCNSPTIALLSASDRVGVLRMVASLGSLVTRSFRALRALAVGSREEDFAAAVY